MATLAPFAEIETRMAADTMGLLANAVATTLLGSEFPVVFDELYVNPLDAIDSVGPAARILDSDVAAYELEQGAELSIRGKAYVWRSAGPDPDGPGMTLVRLRRAED
jgi:hypothetical protein